jgi:hypothetical protein
MVACVSSSRIVATLSTGWSGFPPSIDRVLMVSPVSLRKTPKHCFKLRERAAVPFVLLLARSIHESGWSQQVCTQVPLHHFLEWLRPGPELHRPTLPACRPAFRCTQFGENPRRWSGCPWSSGFADSSCRLVIQEPPWALETIRACPHCSGGTMNTP